MGKILDLTGNLVGGDDKKIEDLQKEVLVANDQVRLKAGELMRKELAEKVAKDNEHIIKDEMEKIVQQEGTSAFAAFLQYLSFELNMWMGGFVPGYTIGVIITNPDIDNSTSVLAACNHPDPVIAKDTKRTNQALLKAIQDLMAINEAREIQKNADT